LDDVPEKVCFEINFIPDPTEKARFESAMFQVTFGRDGGEKNHAPLTLLDVFPRTADDLISRTFFSAYAEGDSSNKIHDDEPPPTSSREGVLRIYGGKITTISGQGVHSPTATWNFVEGDTHGLGANYKLWVRLPSTSRVWMKLYAKAVLVKPEGLRKRVTLQAGSLDEQYERRLDLRGVALENKNGS